MKPIQDNSTVRGRISRVFIVIEFEEYIRSASSGATIEYTERLVGCFLHHGLAKSFATHMNAQKTSKNIEYLIVETDIDNSKLEFI
jgi:hypothetical protein